VRYLQERVPLSQCSLESVVSVVLPLSLHPLQPVSWTNHGQAGLVLAPCRKCLPFSKSQRQMLRKGLTLLPWSRLSIFTIQFSDTVQTVYRRGGVAVAGSELCDTSFLTCGITEVVARPSNGRLGGRRVVRCVSRAGSPSRGRRCLWLRRLHIAALRFRGW